MSKIEAWIFSKSSRQRLLAGIFFCVLTVIAYFIIERYDTGFFGGFTEGILAGLGIGLVVTHKQQKRL